MGECAHLSTWIATEAKQRFASAAARQGLSDSALLKRLVEQMLAAGGDDATVLASEPAGGRGKRVTVRLVPEDRALLRERATARGVATATYISLLVRAHLRHVAPLPDRELAALRAAVNELSAIGRNLNTMTRLLHQGSRAAVPERQHVQTMLQICEALRDRFRDLIRANLISWEIGHAEHGG